MRMADASPPFVRWNSRHPWPTAVAVAVAGTLLTVVGSVVGQVAALPADMAMLVLAGFVAVSAGVGLALMTRRHRPRDYGLRTPTGLRRAAYAAPLAIIPVLVLVAGGVHVPASTAAAAAALTVAVGVNEEVWFRGLVPAALARLGDRPAILGSSALFGVLHLANALQARTPVYLALQAVFAFVVAFALLVVVRRTGSLWIPIVWHAAYDHCSYLGGDVVTPATTAALGASCALLLGYGVWLWRRPVAHP